jgi:hypothetical protein
MASCTKIGVASQTLICTATLEKAAPHQRGWPSESGRGRLGDRPITRATYLFKKQAQQARAASGYDKVCPPSGRQPPCASITGTMACEGEGRVMKHETPTRVYDTPHDLAIKAANWAMEHSDQHRHGPFTIGGGILYRVLAVGWFAQRRAHYRKPSLHHYLVEHFRSDAPPFSVGSFEGSASLRYLVPGGKLQFFIRQHPKWSAGCPHSYPGTRACRHQKDRTHHHRARRRRRRLACTICCNCNWARNGLSPARLCARCGSAHGVERHHWAPNSPASMIGMNGHNRTFAKSVTSAGMM